MRGLVAPRRGIGYPRALDAAAAEHEPPTEPVTSRCAHAHLDGWTSRLALLLSRSGLRCTVCGRQVVLEPPTRALVVGGFCGAVVLATAASAVGWSDLGGALMGAVGVVGGTLGWTTVQRARLVARA